jgi:hypothetical protein
MKGPGERRREGGRYPPGGPPLDSSPVPPILLPEMAEKKAPAKSPKPKSEAKPKAKAAAAPGDAPAKASAKAAEVSSRGPCTVEGCKQPLRAKGYCRKHFLAWRRGKLGAHHAYKTCSKEACRKPREYGGLCAEHAGKAQPAAEATS